MNAMFLCAVAEISKALPRERGGQKERERDITFFKYLVKAGQNNLPNKVKFKPHTCWSRSSETSGVLPPNEIKSFSYHKVHQLGQSEDQVSYVGKKQSKKKVSEATSSVNMDAKKTLDIQFSRKVVTYFTSEKFLGSEDRVSVVSSVQFGSTPTDLHRNVFLARKKS